MPTRIPAAFVGHGSAMNALEHNRFTEAWGSLGARLARRRAILAISAHLFVNATAVTAMSTPRTIHDFFGFPYELFAVQYPRARTTGTRRGHHRTDAADVGRRREDGFGIDHGTWSVLCLAGMAAARGETAQTLIDGCTMGSPSTISYTVGLDREVPPDSHRPASEIPDGDVPPGRTNT